jgi:hypothetical protein
MPRGSGYDRLGARSHRDAKLGWDSLSRESALIEDGCTRAIATGTERLTIQLLDGIELNLGNLPGRDPTAGEIPPVPPRPAVANTKRTGGKRPRNTVFDDHGDQSLPKAATDA